MTKLHCSEIGPLIVLEGMPGAGKTTVAQRLAAEGRQVVGEYTTAAGRTLAVTEHPRVSDDAAHQGNWLLKCCQAHAACTSGAVYVDRDWLSALAYAYSITDGGTLLRERARWAFDRLCDADLVVGDAYVVFHLDPATSLRRRAGRLTAGHPWSEPEPLHRLRRFYDDPVTAIAAVCPDLADLLAGTAWREIHGASTEQQNLRLLRDLADRP